MQPGKVSIGEAVSWVGGGWKIFRASPGAWMLIGLVDLLISSAIQFVPFIGMFLTFLAAPLFTAGVMYAAREVEAGREIRLDYLFQGFREPGRLGPLIGLGGIYIGSLLAIVVLCALALVMSGATASLALDAIRPRGLPSQQALYILLVVLVAIALFIPVLMALYYATPLVMFDRMPVWSALGSSFKACLRNFLPLLVFGLVLFILLLVLALIFVAVIGLFVAFFITSGASTGETTAGVVVAVIVGMLLLYLVSVPLIPILTGMNFCSYRSVYKDHRKDSATGMAG